MDTESEIQFLKNRVAALRNARELRYGLRWVMEGFEEKVAATSGLVWCRHCL